jgi:hypothetical protein
MQLLLNDTSLSIAQLAPDFVILDQPTEFAPTEGEILLHIDGSESRWHVFLPQGIRRGHKKTRIE